MACSTEPGTAGSAAGAPDVVTEGRSKGKEIFLIDS